MSNGLLFSGLPSAGLRTQQGHQAQATEALSSDLKYAVREAVNSSELRAAASVRAASFYTYPEDRSEFAIRSHQKMKLDGEWNALERKTAGEDEAYIDCRVTCIIAHAPAPSSAEELSALSQSLDPSCQLPGETAADPPQIVIGTLDMNEGRKLPAEELTGTKPESAKITGQGRAYLSNVCVAPGARRRGVARQLLLTAQRILKERGTEVMYIHVAKDNPGAHRCYLEFGFQQEDEESDSLGAMLGRPPRYLLWKTIE